MARLRTHHKRKARQLQRQERLFETVLSLTLSNCLEAGIRVWFKGMNAALEAIGWKWQPVELDAEPFWDEWPDHIDG